MKFYMFIQNNTGGVFHVDNYVCHRLFIQAENKYDAEKKAVELGVYYNECASGEDCSCCGDRWTKPMEFELPHWSGHKTTEGLAQHLADEYGWTSPDARIFYANGYVKEIFKQGDQPRQDR